MLVFGRLVLLSYSFLTAVPFSVNVAFQNAYVYQQAVARLVQFGSLYRFSMITRRIVEV